MTVIKSSNEEKTMGDHEDFTARFGRDFNHPSEAAESLLHGGENLPDPNLILASAYAMREMARTLADRLDEAFALYSPQQAAEFVPYVSGTLGALGRSLPKVPALLEEMTGRGDLPAECGARIADERALLDEAGMWTSDSTGTLDPVTRRIATFAEEYVGFEDGGSAAYVHALAAELSSRPGVAVTTVHEAHGKDGGVASVVFTWQGEEFHLADTLGWQLTRWRKGECRDFDVRGAFASSVHPAAVVDEALAALPGPAT